MKKNMKKIDYLLYISSFLSLSMIIILLTSSSSISYNINKKDNTSSYTIQSYTFDQDKRKNKNLDKQEVNAKYNNEQIDLIDKTIEKNKESIKKILNQTDESINIESSIQPVKNIERKVCKVYIVKKGDNLWKIAKKNNITISAILKKNKIKNANLIFQGQKIIIPADEYIDVSNKIIHRSTKKITQKKHYNISKKINKKFKFFWPLKGRVSSEFGVRRSPYNKKMEFHTGIDIAAKLGKNFRAAERGKVTFEGIKGGYGKTIIIQHKNGYKTLYAHALLTFVKNGQHVEKGQLIGRVGNTGLSTGPHLHFEIRKFNVAIDPVTLINKRYLYY